MRIQKLGTLLIGAAALALGACGGGNGGVNSTPFVPPPPPPPPPTAGIIANATASQEFAGKGASSQSAWLVDAATATLQDSAQAKIRFDVGTGIYEILLPSSGSWQALSLSEGAMPWRSYVTADDSRLSVREDSATMYSALGSWASASNSGHLAIGIPTANGDVPTTGNATYTGMVEGSTNQTVSDALDSNYRRQVMVGGTVDLSFDFGAGTLFGHMDATLSGDWWSYTMPRLEFANTVYSSGGTTFSGEFDTAVAGLNSFSGRFTGPLAQELIGNFAFPYAFSSSAPDWIDSGTFQAVGVFVGKRP